jgi:hypothetical protein
MLFGFDRERSQALIHIPAYFASTFDILGARSMILKVITLCTHVVIGAGFVFNKHALAFSITAGNPARIVGTIATPSLRPLSRIRTF